MTMLCGFAHLAVLLASLLMSLAAPADELTQAEIDEVFKIPESYDDGEDLFVPPNELTFDPFDWRLCQILNKREHGNIVVSPISLKFVLAMVYEGAANKTAEEIRAALNLPVDRLQSRNKFFEIHKSLQTKHSDFVLDVASKMFIRRDVTARVRYAKIMRAFYNADVQNLDFNQNVQAVETINSWVRNATHGHIKSMFNTDVLTPNTMMLLLNAIYFKGHWRYPFSSNFTATGNFYVSPGKNVVVPLMNMTQNLYYSESVQLDAKILRLPYMGKKYSMFLVLPNKKDGLENLLNTVDPVLLRKHMFLMEDIKVNVVLPRFNFEYTTELEDILKEMGIEDMFNPEQASFPGIVRKTSVYVSKVLQKAGLDVNEEGTEAYVTTGVTFDDRIGGFEIVDFHATHPFMFFIQDEKTGTVVFVGKVVDPSSKEATLR